MYKNLAYQSNMYLSSAHIFFEKEIIMKSDEFRDKPPPPPICTITRFCLVVRTPLCLYLMEKAFHIVISLADLPNLLFSLQHVNTL